MVRLRLVGGCLSTELQARLEEAARLHAGQELAAAALFYREILNQVPRQPDALFMLGVISMQKGEAAVALSFVEAALDAKPDYAAAWFNRSIMLRVLGREPEALQSARKAAELAPHLAEAWDMIAQLLQVKGELADALKCHEAALGLQPKNIHFIGNYAHTLFTTGDLLSAYRVALCAVELDPSYPPMLLGNILRAMGYPELAAAHFARTYALRPDFADAAASEAMARLQIGEWERGWKIWEQRSDFEAATAMLPLWQGQKVGSLFLYEDQGLGDALQFLRYLPLLKSRVGTVVLRVSALLKNLCAENFSEVELISGNAPMPETDARCRLSSLPFFFATDLHNIPDVPYLFASGGHALSRIAETVSPRIGLVWAGNAKFRNDAARSLNFSQIEPLLKCKGAHFVSLQKEAQAQKEVAQWGVLDAAPLLNDFADTAAVIFDLDLVITVDTATAHLAGALGKPVWILLPFDSDWRWLLGREDSPWYPTARLFRQRKPGDWGPVIEAVAGEVQKLVAGDRSVLQPSVAQGEIWHQNPDALSLT